MAQQAASEKTEKATPKKRKDAREQGQVLKSIEASTTFCGAVMFAVMLIILPAYIRQLMETTYSYISGVSPILYVDELRPDLFTRLFRDAVFQIALITLPLFAAALGAGIAINLLQVGFLFTTKPLMPKLSKISPLAGFKRMFSVRSLTELIKSILKTVIIGVIVWMDYVPLLEKLPMMMGLDVYSVLIEALSTAFTIALKCTVILAFIAGLDYLYQWWRHEKDLKMTKQEVKDEDKQTEGNPETKMRIKSKQRQMSAMRMMEKVPLADVVITNPTHFAVALKYEDGVDSAPVVVAKGQDYLAQKIKEKAREHGIEIVEDKSLAQALFAMCEVGDEIPEDLYHAVIDSIGYILIQKNQARARGVRVK